MLQKIRHTIDRHRLFRGGGTVLVGVSGGADSVALLYALHFLQKHYKLSLYVVHLNHCMRGDAAEADARFVRQLAWRLRIPVMCDMTDVPALAGSKGISLEMAAREARYALFKRVADQCAPARLAIAHTADDQAETILLRLTRGSSLQGLAGIPYQNEVYGVSMVRPMRDVSHADGVQFLESHGLNWREDASNQDMRFLRNRVRHNVLPLLAEELNPRIKRTLVRTGQLLREENDWLDELAARILKTCRYRSDPLALRADLLREQPCAAQRRVLLNWLASNGVDISQIDSSSLFRLEQMLGESRGTRTTPLPGGWMVVQKYEKLVLKEGDVDAYGTFRIPVRVPGETVVPEHDLRVVTQWRVGVVKQADRSVGHLPAEATFSGDVSDRGRLCIRSWQRGDRFRPLGMRGTKKLQDLFVDEKVPREERWRVPLLTCGREIIWVPGYQVARGWEVKSADQPTLHVHIDRLGG